ncbi:hypothetical protein GCM10009558_100880 [Virgisporangium aurantiacum]
MTREDAEPLQINANTGGLDEAWLGSHGGRRFAGLASASSGHSVHLAEEVAP